MYTYIHFSKVKAFMFFESSLLCSLRVELYDQKYDLFSVLIF